jgi:putative ABC transport system permease protein
MRPFVLLYLYRNRLRVHTAQELLAGLGVATAVALVFATLVANGSISGSAAEVIHAAAGSATLQIEARGPDGVPGQLLERVEELPGVKRAAPLLEETATVTAGEGRSAAGDTTSGITGGITGGATGGTTGSATRSTTITITGTTVGLATIDGLARTVPLATLAPGGIGLSLAAAQSLGLGNGDNGPEQSVAVLLRGASRRLKVAAVLGPQAFGALSHASVAVMPLPELQRLAGLSDRISRVLVEVDPGAEAQVRKGLQHLAGSRLDVTPANEDLALLRQALKPSGQASDLFSAISALLGFLFAFNALLLTVPDRRQAIADLRVDGTGRGAIVQMVVSQGLFLGIAASLVGLAGGWALSGAFYQSSGYLSRSFTLGAGTVIGSAPVLLALSGGLLAACLASIVPLLDLRAGRALDAVYRDDGAPGNALGEAVQRRAALGGAALLALGTAMFVLVPSAAIEVCLLLALATMLFVPPALAGALRLAGAAAERFRGTGLLSAALTSLRATTLSSLALAATGAVALFGSVALGGSRADLLRGIHGYASGYTAGADVWVVDPHDNQAIDDFVADGKAAAIARLPGVRAVSAFQGSFLNMGGRRLWVIAWPRERPLTLLDGQILSGKAADAGERIRKGGWIAVSAQVASEHHTGPGGLLTLATPAGYVPFRIAATTTNFGWPPGAVVMNTADYGHYWSPTPPSAPTALGVQLDGGGSGTRAAGDTGAGGGTDGAGGGGGGAVTTGTALAEIGRALGPSSGLEVLTAGEREGQIDASAGEGLGQLAEIATLLTAAAILALTAAMGSSIWRRRAALAGLRLEGTTPRRLRRVLGIEAALMLSAGCLTGAVLGMYGQIVIDSYLKHVTGFPVASFSGGVRPLEVFVAVTATVLAATAVPAWFASRVSPTFALNE